MNDTTQILGKVGAMNHYINIQNKRLYKNYAKCNWDAKSTVWYDIKWKAKYLLGIIGLFAYG